MTPTPPMDSQTHTRLNISAGVASVSVALLLVVAKLWALAQTDALSVAASLADSALDLMVASGGLLAIYYASRPPDEDHTFGHTAAEDLAALGQSLFIFVSSAVIAVTAVRRLIADTGEAPTQEGAGIAVMVLSIILTLGLVSWQRYVAARTGSKVVAADRLHYLGDLIPNLGAIVALAASASFGLYFIDSVVALFAAAFLAFGAMRIFKSAWDALMDRAAPPEIVSQVETIAGSFPGVHDFHDLKTRMSGSKPFIHLHIEVDGDQSLREAHAISAGLKRALLAEIPQADIIIHKDVAGEAD